MLDESFPVLSADLQVRLWARLQMARQQYLGEALAAAVIEVPLETLDAELHEFVGGEKLSPLTKLGLRGEQWYAVPSILAARPWLLGYYRLLYGISQKDFYSGGAFGGFKALEESGRLTKANQERLPALCRSLAETGWHLLRGVEPVQASGIHELQLLTLGPQFRGGENNRIGQGATKDVFTLIKQHVSSRLVEDSDRTLVLTNAAGRSVKIVFGSDPDIAVIESLPTHAYTSLSIEIKGGGDRSNVHNRLGEAEKSHQKARASGCSRFWTIVRANVDLIRAAQESPTTTHFFLMDRILDPSTDEYARFRDQLHQALGI